MFWRRRVCAAHENLLGLIREVRSRTGSMEVLAQELERRMYDKIPDSAREEVFRALLGLGLSQMVVGMIPDIITQYLRVQHEHDLGALAETLEAYNKHSDDVALVVGQSFNEEGEPVVRICAEQALPLIEAQQMLMGTLQEVMANRLLTRTSGEYSFGFRLEARTQSVPRELGELLNLLAGEDCGDPECPVHGRNGILAGGIMDLYALLGEGREGCGDPSCEHCYPPDQQDEQVPADAATTDNTT